MFIQTGPEVATLVLKHTLRRALSSYFSLGVWNACDPMPCDKTGHFYYAWFPTIYEADTQHLTLAECGAYRRLIDHYMMTRSPLPCSDRALARIIGCGVDEWIPISETVKAYFKAKDGMLYHTFCERELAVHNSRMEKWKENGQKGGRPKQLNLEANNPTGSKTKPNGNPAANHNITYHNITYDRSEDLKKINDCPKGRLVSSKAIEKASEMARLRGFDGGWELGIDLENQFLGWIKEEPRNPDAAFLKWAPGFLDNQRP